MSKGYFKLRTAMAIGAMVVLAACGGNTDVPANSSVDTGTPAATTGVEGTTGTEGTTSTEDTTGAEPMATAAPTDASTTSEGMTSGDTGTGSTGTTTGTATPDAGGSSATTGTTTPEAGTSTTGADMGAAMPLTGPNISYGGITFDVDETTIPNISVQSGPVNMMDAGATGTGSTGTAGSGTLSGTVFTFEGMNMGANAGSMTSAFQPRIVVIPVSQLASYEASMMATGAGSDAGTTGTDNSASGTTTPEAGATTSADSSSTMTGTSEGLNDNLFISELSRTISSQSAFPSTSIANSMILTRALSLMGFGGYTPAFQSNGEYLDFQNGRGVRFVTAFQPQGSNPAALNSLYYMFHGLTNDDQYYVMALMPLQSSLIGSGTSATGAGTSGTTTESGTATPAAGDTMTDTTGTSAGAIEFPTGGDAAAYQSYLDEVVTGLDQAAGGTSDAAFSQSLQQYDTLIQSLNVAEGTQ